MWEKEGIVDDTHLVLLPPPPPKKRRKGKGNYKTVELLQKKYQTNWEGKKVGWIWDGTYRGWVIERIREERPETEWGEKVLQGVFPSP